MRTRDHRRESRRAAGSLRRSFAALAIACVLVACGAAAALTLDSLDGDDDGGTADVVSALPLALCSLPPPSESARVHAPTSDSGIPKCPSPPRLSLRAPPRG